MKRLGCTDVAEAVAGAPCCCESCHNDYEDETDEPREIQLADDVVAYVCCCGKADWVRVHAAEIANYYEGNGGHGPSEGARAKPKP